MISASAKPRYPFIWIVDIYVRSIGLEAPDPMTEHDPH
jgi:hypothetical protein